MFLRGIELSDEIEELIYSNREDDYWDFKEKHHSNKANLLHDIICMANNRVDRDAFIIFGIEDGTFKVAGVENDENRRKLHSHIEELQNKNYEEN